MKSLVKKPTLLLPLLLTQGACAALQPRDNYVPAQEAAWFKFPEALPQQEQQRLPGRMAAAMRLAMDDFLPRDVRPAHGAPPQEICLAQRQSYDVQVAPGPEGIIWVGISLAPGACTRGPGPLIDMGATYAVDVRRGRILAVRSP